VCLPTSQPTAGKRRLGLPILIIDSCNALVPAMSFSWTQRWASQLVVMSVVNGLKFNLTSKTEKKSLILLWIEQMLLSLALLECLTNQPVLSLLMKSIPILTAFVHPMNPGYTFHQ